jgi:hypothetical protein
MCRNMTLSIFVKGKVDFRCVEIWLWVFLLKEKLTLDDFRCFEKWLWVFLLKEKLTVDVSKYDF